MSFSWSSQSTIDDVLATYALPHVLFNIPSIRARLRNIKYFRAGIRIGIRINGTRFHYGKLLVSYSPAAIQTGAKYATVANIFSASGFPNVTVSAGENEVHELIVPYALPTNYIDLKQINEPQFSLGVVEIRVLNPLRLAATTNSVQVSIFANFENVQVAGYTTRIMPMSVPPNVFGPYLSPSGLKLLAQGGVEGLVKSTKGIVSGTLETLSGTLGRLTVVPLIGSYAKGGQILTAGLSSIAAVLGYSKPNTQIADIGVRVRQQNLAVSKGLEYVETLAMDPANSVDPGYHLMGSYENEQSLLDVLMTPSLLTMFTTNASGALGHVFPVAPWYAYTEFQQHAGVDHLVAFPSILTYACAPYMYWRGSLRFCIQITCSAFHSGRIRIAWEPDDDWLTEIPKGEMPNLVNRIIDIQQESTIYFTVPFLQTRPWLEQKDMMTSQSVVDNKRFSNGMLSITTVNAFTHPDSPMPKVFCNVWVSAGPDFQVARPSHANLHYADKPKSATLRAECSTRETMKFADYPPLMEGSFGYIDDKMMMGERITSIRDICSRYGLVEDADKATAQTIPCFPNLKVNIPADRRYALSHLDWYRHLFRFSRGSMNFKCISTGKADNDLVRLGNYNYPAGSQKVSAGYIATTTPEVTAADGILLFDRTKTNNIEASIPYYSDSNVQIHASGFTPISSPGILVDGPGLATYSCIGDDFNMGFLIGPPAMASLAKPPDPEPDILEISSGVESFKTVVVDEKLDTLQYATTTTKFPFEFSDDGLSHTVYVSASKDFQ